MEGGENAQCVAEELCFLLQYGGGVALRVRRILAHTEGIQERVVGGFLTSLGSSRVMGFWQFCVTGRRPLSFDVDNGELVRKRCQPTS